MKKSIIRIITLSVAVIMALSLASCDLFGYEEPKDPWELAVITEDAELGEGSKTIEVELVVEEHKVTFTIHTDAETLGEALEENLSIDAEEGAYGRYITMINGIYALYEVDGSYWAFYQSGEYLMTGVDSTNISGGEHFEIVYSK